MRCSQCKTHDLYLSTSGNMFSISWLTKSVRCHRCCHKFKVFRWVNVPKKNSDVNNLSFANQHRTV